MIERNGDWIVTEALFKENGQEKFEELGIETYEVLEPSFIRFRLANLMSYNEGSSSKPTTILLSSGDMYSINVPFKEFDEFILKQEK